MKKNFTQLRHIMNMINKSIYEGYLSAEWKEFDKENIVELYNGMYAHCDDVADVEGYYYHLQIDSDEFVYDEINECYILSENSVFVKSGRNRDDFYTHENSANSLNNIFRYDGEYIDEYYMESYDLVFTECGSIAHRDDVYYWESDDEYHFEPENDDRLIQSYSFRPNPSFKYIKNENPYTNLIPFYGIELEVENRDERNSNGAMAEQINAPHLYFKSDGSLENGFEIVTHPLSFNWIQENKNEFEVMLNDLKKWGFNSYDANTCGMHIHISKKSFGTWQLFRFIKFFNEYKEFIVSISQRKIEQIKKWASIEDETESELIYKAKKKCGNSSRYCAINLQNGATIEIRIFRGTLNYASFMKNIEFVDALYNYTKESNNCTLIGFKEFINSTSSYSNLKKFIHLKNI